MSEWEMGEVSGTNWWSEEVASLMDDPTEISWTTSFEVRKSEHAASASEITETESSGESLKEHAVGFLMAWCEILMELARGCRDILQQNLFNEDSYVVTKLRGPCSNVSKRLRFLNEFLPEDRDPVQAWSIVFIVFILALAGLFLH